MKKTKKIIAAIALTGLLTGGCTSREEIQEYYPSDVSFSKPVEILMPANAQNAEKRKFADFTCDGIEDMAEVRDTSFWKQNYVPTIFPGEIENHPTEGELLGFSENTFDVKIPLRKGTWSQQVKIDSGDPNGDGCADFIFTELKGGMSNPHYVAKVALNQGDGTKYKFSQTVRGTNGGRSLDYLLRRTLQRNLAKYHYSDDTSLSSHLAIDWSDVDGNGTDDLMILWDHKNDLDIDVFFTEGRGKNGFMFTGYANAFLPEFMNSRSIRNIDTEDINGDGVSDLLIYMPDGDTTTISSALGYFDRNSGTLSYEAQKDVTGKGADYDFFTRFEKQDSFDGNFDGCADYVHLGKKSGTPSMTYKFTEHQNCGNKSTDNQRPKKVEAYKGGWQTFDSF